MTEQIKRLEHRPIEVAVVRGRGRDGFVRGFRGHERGFERGQILEIGIDLLRF